MISPPPVLLIFDLTALLSCGTRNWQEFSRIGQSFVPKVVLDEIQTLATQGTDPQLEPSAREFDRFYPTSGWNDWDYRQSHPSLRPASGATVSKRARQSLAIAESAIGLAHHQPGDLVVLVTNDQPLLKRINELDLPNLAGVPTAELIQWSRTQRRPLLINQKLRSVATSSPPLVAQTPLANPAPAARRQPPAPPPPRATGSRSTATRPVAPRPVTPQTSSYRSAHPSALSQIASGLLALAIAGTLGLVLWRVVQPASFNQFWQRTGLPALPGQSPAPKPKK